MTALQAEVMTSRNCSHRSKTRTQRTSSMSWHSRTHGLWSLRMGTSLEDCARYTITTCFETFPLPWPPGTEPTNDPRVMVIGESGANLDELRRSWLDPEGASEGELSARCPTSTTHGQPGSRTRMRHSTEQCGQPTAGTIPTRRWGNH
jgi:hypothetical protein